MRPNELPCESTEVLTLEPVGGVGWWSPAPVADAEIAAVASGDDVVLEHAGQAIRVQLVGAGTLPGAKILAHQGPVRASVVKFAKEQLHLKVQFWSPGPDFGSEPLQLGVPDKVIEQCRNAWGAQLLVQECLERLHDEFVASSPASGAGRIAILARGAADESLSLVGRSRRADLRKDSSGRWAMQRLVQSRRPQGGELRLASGGIQFVDATALGAIRGASDRIFESLVDRAEGFVRLWRTYNTKEWALAKQRKIDAGEWPYDTCEQRDDGAWVFRCAPGRPWDLPPDTTVEAEGPPEPTNESDNPEPKARTTDDDLTLVEASEDGLLEGEERDLLARQQAPTFLGRVVALRRGLVVVKAGDDNPALPPKKGVLRVALLGDRVRLARRCQAALVVRNKATPLPTLGVLLEGQPPPTITPRTYSAKEVEKKLKKLYPKRTFTEKQFAAVMLALNTPDIALIQGPPGTGKTTVISAIIACLADLEGGENGPDIVITSAQHEAVDNVARRTRTHSLPVSRFDPRPDAENDRGFIDRFQDDLRRKVTDEMESLSRRAAFQGPQ